MSDQVLPVTGETKPTETVEPKTETVTVESLQESVKNLEQALRKANKEAEDRRKKLDAYDQEKAAAEAAKLSETDKLKLEKEQAEKKATEAIAKANERLIKAAVMAGASNFIDADAAYALVDKSKIEVDDEGEVKGVTEALAELATAKPGLLKGKTNPNLNVTNSSATNTSGATDKQWADFMNGGPLPI